MRKTTIIKLLGGVLFYLFFQGSVMAVTISYTYDAANRLASANYGDCDIANSYDTNGNLTERSITSGCQGSIAGDINGDGQVTLEDVIMSLQVCSSIDVVVAGTGDVNGDNRTGLAESIYALQKIAGL